MFQSGVFANVFLDKICAIQYNFNVLVRLFR